MTGKHSEAIELTSVNLNSNMHIRKNRDHKTMKGIKTMNTKIKKTRFTLIHSADFDAYKDEHVTLTPEEKIQNEKKRIIWPLNCYCVLIQHPKLGNILFDTGIDSEWKTRWPENLAKGYPVHQSCDLKEKLKELSLYPDDIDMIILSHMHFDHVGNLRMFRGTKAGKNVWVQEEEAKHAFLCANRYDCGYEAYRGDGYVRHEFNNLDGIEFHLIKGDIKLAEDLELLLLPGHTPGTTGLVIRTELTGTVIFPSDAIYNHFNYGPPAVLPGMCARPDEFGASIEKCRKIAEAENGRIFYSHDVKTFPEYKKSPEWYE